MKDEASLWVKTGERPYTRGNGTATTLDVWSRPCRVCGVAFDIAVPSGFDATASKAFGAVHCQAHKLTREQVIERWQAGIALRGAR